MTAGAQAGTKTRVAVVTGHHEYDVVGFQSLFRGIPELDVYPQNMEDFVTDSAGARRRYDVVLFYNFHLPAPGTGQEQWSSRMKLVLGELGEREQGILLLHHAIVAFPDWRPWTEICGIESRAAITGYTDQRLRIEPRPSHPITKGLTSWELVDETYVMDDAGEGSEVLLTTDHPNSMRTIGWTREYKRARVFCLQSGHDAQAWNDAQFRTVIARGAQWLARRM